MSPEQDQLSGNGNATLEGGMDIDGASLNDASDVVKTNVGGVSFDATDEVNGASIDRTGLNDTTEVGDGAKESFDESASVSMPMQSEIQTEQPMPSEQLPVTNMESLQPRQQEHPMGVESQQLVQGESLMNTELQQVEQQNQLIQPIQPVQSVQYTQPLQSPQLIQPTQQMQSMQSAHPMQFEQAMTPIGSGTGDIIIDGMKEPRDKKKLLLIIGAAVVGVTLLVLIVLGMSKLVNGGVVASNAREAFNLYANYFLTGEISMEDIKEGDEPVEIEEEEEESIDGETIIDNEGEDMDVEIEMKEINSVEEDETFFDEMIRDSSKEGEEYRKKLMGYYLDYQKLYLDELKNEIERSKSELMNDNYVDMVEGLLDRYKHDLELVIAYYGGGSLMMDEILENYSEGGASKVNTLFDEKNRFFEGISDEYGSEYGELMRNYEEQALKLIEAYSEMNCIVDADIDYECVMNNSVKETADISDMVGYYYDRMARIIRNCYDRLYSDLDKFVDMVYVDNGEEYDED